MNIFSPTKGQRLALKVAGSFLQTSKKIDYISVYSCKLSIRSYLASQDFTEDQIDYAIDQIFKI